MKKYAEAITPRCQDVNFEQICTILKRDQNASYHDGIHRSTMISRETLWHDGNLSYHDGRSPNPPENYKYSSCFPHLTHNSERQVRNT
jgi:hypothetical protein